MRVEISEPAENDLLQIAGFIAVDNPDRALSYCAELENACLSLADYPELGPLLKKRGGYDVRRLVHGQFIVLYQIEGDCVMILRIVHGARNLEMILSNDD